MPSGGQGIYRFEEFGVISAEKGDDTPCHESFGETAYREMGQQHRRDRYRDRVGAIERSSIGKMVENRLQSELDGDEKRSDVYACVSSHGRGE